MSTAITAVKRVFPTDDAESQNQRVISKDILDSLGADLSKDVAKRRGQRLDYELRWLDDLRHYNGLYTADVKLQPGKSDVFLEWTRQYCNAAEAAFIDLMDPVDDRLFGLSPTPVADLPGQGQDQELAADAETGEIWVNQHGQQLTWGDLQRVRQHEAERRAKLMEDEIADQWQECRANQIFRKIAHQGVVLGTGVLRGPIAHNTTRQRWRPDPEKRKEWRLQYVRELGPAIQWVDLWHWFPDMAVPDIPDMEKIFGRKLMYRHQLEKLKPNPEYDAAAIDVALATEPHEYYSKDDKYTERAQAAGLTILPARNQYEVYEAEGPISPDALLAYGYSPEFVQAIGNVSAWGSVTFVGSTIIRIALSPLETSESSFGAWQWEEDETIVFGRGVSRSGRTPQKIANAALRAMADNSGASVGPIAVIGHEVEPQTPEDARLGANSVLINRSGVHSAAQAVAFFQAQNNQAHYQAMLALAEKLMDDSTGQGKIATQGQSSQVPVTFGEASIQANASNRVQRRAIKRFDDLVVKPLVQRFFDFNMAHNPNPAIKGDVNIEAKGSTLLMVMETQIQALQQMTALVDHPVYGPYMDPKALLGKLAQAQHLQRSDVMLSDTEIEENQKRQGQGQPSPEQIQAMDNQAEREFKTSHQQREFQAKAALQQMEIEAKLIEQGQSQNLKIEEIRAQIEQSREKWAAEIEKTMMVEQNKADMQAQEIAVKMHPENPTNEGI